MHSIINNADQVFNFLDWTTASLLEVSTVIIGQSMLARLRNEWVSNHAPQPTPNGEPEPELVPTSETSPEPLPLLMRQHRHYLIRVKPTILHSANYLRRELCLDASIQVPEKSSRKLY
jgi:hypothetical protein